MLLSDNQVTCFSSLLVV